MENELEHLRKEIDEIDNKLIELFALRMKTVEKIAKYKQDNNIKITNKNRENKINEKIENYPFHIIRHYYGPVSKEIIKASKRYQKDLIKSDFR